MWHWYWSLDPTLMCDICTYKDFQRQTWNIHSVRFISTGREILAPKPWCRCISIDVLGTERIYVYSTCSGPRTLQICEIKLWQSHRAYQELISTDPARTLGVRIGAKTKAAIRNSTFENGVIFNNLGISSGPQTLHIKVRGYSNEIIPRNDHEVNQQACQEQSFPVETKPPRKPLGDSAYLSLFITLI